MTCNNGVVVTGGQITMIKACVLSPGLWTRFRVFLSDLDPVPVFKIRSDPVRTSQSNIPLKSNFSCSIFKNLFCSIRVKSNWIRNPSHDNISKFACLNPPEWITGPEDLNYIELGLTDSRFRGEINRIRTREKPRIWIQNFRKPNPDTILEKLDLSRQNWPKIVDMNNWDIHTLLYIVKKRSIATDLFGILDQDLCAKSGPESVLSENRCRIRPSEWINIMTSGQFKY